MPERQARRLKTDKQSFLGKLTFFFLSLIIFFVGIGLIVSGSIAQGNVDSLDKEFKELLKTEPQFVTSIHFVISAGCIFTVIGFCGCVGSATESVRALLYSFFWVLCMVLALLVFFIWWHVYITGSEIAIKESMKQVYVVWVDPATTTPQEFMNYAKSLIKPNSPQIKYTAAWISLQGHFSCCGYDSPDDWQNILNVPQYAAYCTENEIKSVVDIHADNFKAGRDYALAQKQLDHISDLSKKTTFAGDCRAVFVQLKGAVTGVTITLLVIQLIFLILCARLIRQIRRKQNASRENGGVEAGTAAIQAQAPAHPPATGILGTLQATVMTAVTAVSDVIVAVESKIEQYIPDIILEIFEPESVRELEALEGEITKEVTEAEAEAEEEEATYDE